MLDRLSTACSTSGGTDTFSTMKLENLESVAGGDDRVDERKQRLAKLRIPAGDVEHRDLRVRERLGKDADDSRAHGLGKLVEAEVVIEPATSFRKIFGSVILKSRPERADPDDAEIVVAHHHGIGGAPLLPVKRRVFR